ncbi:hypothetical protein F4860DRAFT_529376 [Xylaria cubensis]|nr:hypothetical protein F4860DRAFT_529376 [Xylaria cubensis]
MTISQTTTRILRSEWEGRKSRLVELYLDLNLPLLGPNGVIETMANEGFIATKPQYEYQFRVWKVRKNMKRNEYERIIQERQHGAEPTQITIGSRVISDARSRRALRRYAGEMPQAGRSVHHNDNGANLENSVSLMLTEGGRIPAAELASEAIITTTEYDYTASNMATDPDFEPIATNQDGPLLELTNETVGMLSRDSNNTVVYHTDFEDPLSLVNFDLPALHGHNFLFDGLSDSVLDAGVQHHQTLSQQQNGILFDIRNPPCSTADICNAAPAPSAHNTVLNLRNLTNKFMNDLNSVQRFPADFTLALGSILSTDTFLGEHSIGLLNNISIDVATEARLCSRLITSAINGFTGLGNIPASGVMVFLSKHRIMNQSMIPLLTSDLSPAAKSLTENIFRMALEQDNVKVAKFVLDHSNSIHANNTVCLYHGERYTPLQMAARAQSYSVIELLISMNVDVDKSFSGDYNNALDLLLRNRDSKSTIDDRFFSLFDRFMSAGATISASIIEHQLSRSVDHRLTARLIENSTAQVLKSLVSDMGTIGAIIASFEKAIAQRTIRLMIEECQRVNANLCWHYSILLEAVDQDYEELAVLLSHGPTSFSYLYPKNKKKTINNLAFHRCELDRERRNSTRSEAPRSGHEGYLTEARSNVIEHIASCKPSTAFKTALEEGNLESARWILGHDPDLHFASEPDFLRHFEDTLQTALAFGFDDLAWKLVTTSRTREERLSLRWLESLNAAIKMRKPEFVRAIIQSGVDLCSERDLQERDVQEKILKIKERNLKESILRCALEWGNDSIINDIWQLRPGPIHPEYSLMKLIVERGRMEFFWGIFEAWNASCVAECEKWPGAVKLAIQYEDLRLLDELIARGATLNGEALEEISRGQASLRKIILERYRQACSQGGVAVCWHLLWNAIIEYPRSLELMDLLFEFDLVTGRNFQEHEEKATLLAGAIGKGKISPGKEHPKRCLIEKLLAAGIDVNVTMIESACSDLSAKHPSLFNEPSVYGWIVSSCSSRYFDYNPFRRWHIKTTACLLAIERGSTEIVRLLLQKGAEVNKPARFGITHTPLQKAAELNNVEIITLLLEYGAEVNAPPAIFDGATALQFTAIHGNCELAMTLLEHGARLDVPPSKGPDGRWPLEGAAENGRLDMIQLLWDANNGPFDDKQCQKAMRLAEYYGHLGCKDLIMELMEKSSRGP